MRLQTEKKKILCEFFLNKQLKDFFHKNRLRNRKTNKKQTKSNNNNNKHEILSTQETGKRIFQNVSKEQSQELAAGKQSDQALWSEMESPRESSHRNEEMKSLMQYVEYKYEEFQRVIEFVKIHGKHSKNISK